MNYRLYTFVAGLYLSPLQRGLQTAHVVSELMTKYKPDFNDVGDSVYDWASNNKTIIICDAGNHQGVVDCWAELQRTGIDPRFVAGAIFFEDVQSMNGMATACGVVVPEKYWGAQFVPEVGEFNPARWDYTYVGADGSQRTMQYDLNYPEAQFISHIKKYRLAQS